ncbi:MAG TPA: DM13 domain-containing protein [Acidimicrobiales bacterium]|nr:DM13 domain-containing protein [Acidimicrobiales bacterium]
MTDFALSGPRPASGPRKASTVVGLIFLVASALIGGNAFGTRERLWGSETPTARAPAASRDVGAAAAAGGATETTAPAPPTQSVLRSQPWWQGVTTLDGAGTTTAATFTIVPGALQWRVRWTCDTGHLLVRAPSQTRPVVDAACPGPDVGYGARTGPITLQVTADGPWHLVVEQQVDVPLNEPPLAAMTAPGASVVARGSLYRIDQVGTGDVLVYRLPDGTYALRLDNFFVTANSDLEVQFSSLDAPHSTDQVAHATQVSVATLDVTTGSLNFMVPPSIDPVQYKSVVMWCEVQHSAYAAATLRPA